MSVFRENTARNLDSSWQLFTPPPKLTVNQWADEHRYLSPESAAEPGKWSTSRTPYMVEPYREITNPDVELLVLMASSQVGKTEFLLNATAYYADQDPSPQLMIEPTIEIAEAYSKDRLAPMIRDTPRLHAIMPQAKARDGKNTILHKTYPGGHLTMAGANSPSSLASRPIRIALLDEVDRYPVSAGAEGDPVQLVFKRTMTFWNRKKLMASTPGLVSTSRIEPAYQASDKRQYHVPCAQCGTKQVLVWEQVKWTPDASGAHDPSTARYQCNHCGALWDDAERAEAVYGGEWIATAPFKGIAGFHIWSAYNPWVKLKDIVAEFLEANRRSKQGDNEALKVWTNTVLGQSWAEKGETVAADPLMQRRENYSADALPYRVLYLTAGVDVQNDRIEVEVVGWRAENRKDPHESWGVEVIILYGDPAKPEVWNELDEVLQRRWTTEDGRALPLGAVAIDSGNWTSDVYRFTSRRFARHIYAVKGRQGALPLWPILSSASKKHTGKKVFIVGVDTAKDTVYSRLRIPLAQGSEGGPGYCHFPLAYTEQYFKQLTSEHVETKFIKGHPVREWHKQPGTRNEALDRRAYALAVLHSRPVPWELLAKAAPSEFTSQPAGQSSPAGPAGASTGAGEQRPAPAPRPNQPARPVRMRIGR